MHSSPSERAGRAFTLAEIIVVVVILSIAVVIIVPYASSSASQAVSAAQMLASDIQYAQSVSITTQVPTTVSFDSNGYSYRLTNQSGTLIQPMTQKSYVVNFQTISNFGNVSMTSQSFGGATSVTFDSTGAPNNAGSATIKAGSYVYVVNVAAATGNVTVTGS